MLGESVVEGRLPGASPLGSDSSTQLICRRVLMQKPSAGITGLDDSQPPEGVADTALPQRSMTSIWQVSPTTRSARLANVGSPIPREALVVLASFSEISPNPGIRGSRSPGFPGRCSM